LALQYKVQKNSAAQDRDIQQWLFHQFFAIESNNSATVCFFASGSLGLLYPPPPALL
tara:strand:- start:579 stop:749 length:171 start_codon:yes stop_codon:yes gene_type:complete